MTEQKHGWDHPPVPKSDPVNHPSHYHSVYLHVGCGKAIECIDIVRHMNFNLGNVVKYIWRADHKGATIEDLKKARWYLDDEIKRLETEAGTAVTPQNMTQEQANAATKAAVKETSDPKSPMYYPPNGWPSTSAGRGF